LIKLRYGNLEMANKYWLEEKVNLLFCREGKDRLLVKEFREMK